ncbi:MAG: MFS transporter [Tissierellales bacterium]|nr:MFS transporter [Tissierellales bacterium]MBN2828405.1 MFS transporter [Tissierellales bacterium]
MNNIEKIKKNLIKNITYTCLSSFNLTHGIWMLYLAYKGLSLFEIGLLESIFHATSFLMEIPTGIIADIYGRKVSRYSGRALSIISTLLIIISNHIFFFAISFVFSALSYNLESGAGDALIYDSLKQIGEENEYTRYKGRYEIYFQLTSTISLLLGGYLATIDYSLVYKIALIFAVITFIQSLGFTEPNVTRPIKGVAPVSAFIIQLKASFSTVKNERSIAFIIIFMSFFQTLFTTEFFYLQNLQKSLGNSEFQIGLILALGSLLAAFTASNAYKIEQKYKIEKILIVFSVLSIACFWGMTFTTVVEFVFVILSGIEGFMYVTINSYLNSLIPSEQRATILSFDAMSFSFFMIVFFPIFGKIGDLFGLELSFIFAAVLGTLILSLFIRLLIKNN